MKKVLEILQNGENDYRFDTDIDLRKNPEFLQDLLNGVSFAMATKLWGGNEQAVLAIIRILAMADLALSVNRKEMLKQMDDISSVLAKAMTDASRQFQRSGGKIKVFGPGVMPPKSRS